MPELPEVQTTVNGLNKCVRGLVIKDVWSSYNSPFHKGKDNIKDLNFFKKFKKDVLRSKILNASRRGKNILINLSNGKTIIVHMKMTGHFLFGTYEKTKNGWQAKEKSLRDDPFNRHIRLVFILNNTKSLALSDMRKFAKVTLVPTNKLSESEHLKKHGPEPLEKSFNFEKFKVALLKRPNGKIKQVLMNPEIISGIGNIYSDEILWSSGIHPVTVVKKIPETKLKLVFLFTKKILQKGINLGGDSMSDYRNIYGERGKFQEKHNVYQRTGERCKKRGCNGIIKKIKLGGRSAHFCSFHQKL